MKQFNRFLRQTGEYGEVTKIQFPLISVSGLPRARSREVIHFERGGIGEVFSIRPDAIEVVMLNKTDISIHEKAARTDTFTSITVGYELLGTIVNPIGESIEKTKPNGNHKKHLFIDTETIGIQYRATVKKPLHTGVMLVDTLLPIGKGQKELIIGDRKTGKTSFLLTTVKNQVKAGTIVVYAAISRKQEDIRLMLNFFRKEKIFNRIVCVISTTFESPGLIYLTPFTAMTIAEYFRDEGHDVLVIFDDLSSHAKFYREISLIAKRFPGRESYPGDIFHTHASLIERAGNFRVNVKKSYRKTSGITRRGSSKAKKEFNNSRAKDNHKTKEVSITALPVVETIEGDLASYVSTNIMAMTDGHIFFDQGTFAKGIRPAVNIPLSVTRVGRQTQSPLRRDINQKLTKLLTGYEDMTQLAHFGAELSGKVQKTLLAGEKMFALLNQHSNAIIPDEVQLVLIALVWSDNVKLPQIGEVRNNLVQAGKSEKNLKILREIVDGPKTLYDLQLAVNRRKDELWHMIGLKKEQGVKQTASQESRTKPPSTHDVISAIEMRIAAHEEKAPQQQNDDKS